MDNKFRILFIVPHRPNRSPGQRFRFEQYLDYFEANGFSYTYSNIISAKDDAVFYAKRKLLGKGIILVKSFFKRLYDVLRAGKYDIIFIYREAFMLGWTIIEKLLKLTGKKMIFDFDDAIWLENTSEGNLKFNWLKHPEKISKIIRLSDMVFAGNEYLAKYAREHSNNVKVVPTTIDLNYHNNLKTYSNSKICIGWTGSSTTLPYFQNVIPALKTIYKKYADKIKFKVIVDVEYHEPALDLVATQWQFDTEIQELSEIDIGIMPLPDDEWSKGKCGFKGLQYMSLGIPTIMSPVGVNKSIINNQENGFLAMSNEEWVDRISELIESEELRNILGTAGRKTIAEKYSFEAHKENYLNYFTELIETSNYHE